MTPDKKSDCCCSSADGSGTEPDVKRELRNPEEKKTQPEMLQMADSSRSCCEGDAKKGDDCCGGTASEDVEQRYVAGDFIIGTVETPVGNIPAISSRPGKRDKMGTILARCGFHRHSYSVAPGLYANGKPDEKSPVLVTANYKLTFDALRSALDGINAWILVLDTRGINVWCAAGKGTFSTEELVHRINAVQLDRIVVHKNLVLPQLCANGVAGFKVKQQSGFRVIWGPIKAEDIPAFLAAGMRVDKSKREVTFTLSERIVLIPVELRLLLKPALIAFLLFILVSGISREIFSVPQALSRGGMAILAALVGVLSGTVLVPVFLPWIPFRSFYLKGIITGLITGGVFTWWLLNPATHFEFAALILLSAVLSSYLAMNFTGSTPFTSPSGVEKEMKRGIPVQVLMLVVTAVFWISSPFLVGGG